MITIEQVQQLRNLHDAEKEAYMYTHDKDSSFIVYDRWVKACDELNNYIQSITGGE